MLLAAIAVSATACTSLYRRTQVEMPPNVAAELTLRISGAQKAEQITRQAAATLRDNLMRADGASWHESDFDRLEAAAFDFERRVLAARDVAERSGEPDTIAMEIERLSKQAQLWLEYAQTHRAADQATRLKALETLLHLQR